MKKNQKRKHKKEIKENQSTISSLSPAARTAKLDKIMIDRKEVYGDAFTCHESIAQCWSALLDCNIEPWQVALMMSMFKIIRMKYVYREDNYNDCLNYLNFAKRWQYEKCVEE